MAVLVWFATRRTGLAFSLGGMIGRRWRDSGRTVGFAGTTLQASIFITQRLDFAPKCLILSNQLFNEIEQLHQRLAEGRISDGIKLDIRDLHRVVYG
ncbi:MAG: hypothetical protein ACJ8CR_36195 [Roseiflexaceae bacterium]